MPVPDFDVATELTFKSHADTEKMIAAVADPEIGRTITCDEEQFMDRTKIAVYIVAECKPPDRE